MIKLNFGSDPIDTYVRPLDDKGQENVHGSLLRPELRPWSRGVWEEKSKRIGILARKIGGIT